MLIAAGIFFAALAKRQSAVSGSDPADKESSTTSLGEVFTWVAVVQLFVGLAAAVVTKACNKSPTTLNLVMSFLFPEIILPVAAVQALRSIGRPIHEQSCSFEPLLRLGFAKA